MMGFFSAVKKFFGGKAENEEILPEKENQPTPDSNQSPEQITESESQEKETGTKSSQDIEIAKPESQETGAGSGLEVEITDGEIAGDALHLEDGLKAPVPVRQICVGDKSGPGLSPAAAENPQENAADLLFSANAETASADGQSETSGPVIEEAAIEDFSNDFKPLEARAKENELQEESPRESGTPGPEAMEAKAVPGADPPLEAEADGQTDHANESEANSEMLVRLREAEPKLSKWLDIILEGVQGPGDLLWERISFLLRSLDAPADETAKFVHEFGKWLERMEYNHIDEFRSELQYQLALALDLEDEEDERNRLFLKLSEGLARTREQFSRQLDNLFASRGELDDNFWDELEELFIMADLGYEPAMELSARLKERARKGKIVSREQIRELLHAEIEDIFKMPRKISAVNPPEVVLMIGVNGVGKTTTIAKLAHRAKMQGKKVLIAAGDTFRAAAIEQLEIWAKRVGVDFFAKAPGSDPAAVAYEAVDKAVQDGVDVIFVDTAGRLQTKTNLMQELGKIRQVLAKKHPGAPHRSILVLDATTGQNALSQAKLFKEAASADELILTKLDGTARGGVAIAVAMQEKLPISYVGLGEKMEDLRPFNGADYATALLGLENRKAA